MAFGGRFKNKTLITRLESMPESRIMTGRSSELRLRTRSCSRKKRSYLGRISIPMFFGDSHVLAMGLSSFSV